MAVTKCAWTGYAPTRYREVVLTLSKRVSWVSQQVLGHGYAPSDPVQARFHGFHDRCLDRVRTTSR